MFSGFPPEALEFYAGLEADNAKPYWEEHREIYEGSVRDPMEELIAELHDEFGAGKVFRPYRDVRFAKDKSPYKTHCGALLSPGRARLMGYYVELSAGGLRLGVGVYQPDAGALGRVRRAIDDERSGRALVRIAADLERGGMPLLAPELKTAPRGYPRDHPRIDLLRRKRFAALATPGSGPWLHRREVLDRVRATWRLGRPLHDWLEANGA